jgi:hypothetical protein
MSRSHFPGGKRKELVLQTGSTACLNVDRSPKELSLEFTLNGEQ